MNLSLEFIQRIASDHEGVDIEFKETTGQLNRGMETLCGMINGSGGIVLFGISNRGKIIGQEIGDKTTREIGEAINKFDPAVDIQPIYVRIDNSDKYIIAFRTDGQETEKPYMWDGKPYRRYDSVTSVMPREQFFRLYELQHGLKYKWENDVNHSLSLEDLDEQLIHSVIQSAVRRGRLSSVALNDNVPTALKRLDLIKDGNICNSAAVLFGKRFTDYPQCRLRLARFRGTTKRDFIDNQQEEGNIFQLVDVAMSFFFKHLNLSGTTHHRIVREDELEIPYDALRESVVNAYCHMNWGLEVATVGIAVYDDRIEIENAGRFPVRISPDALMLEEEAHRKNTSLPPNPIIANVMYIGGLIEHWGRGLSMMASECERVGLPAPSFYQNGTVVKIIFARPKVADKDTAIGNRSTAEAQLEHSRSRGGTQPNKYNNAIIKLVKSIGEDWLASYELRELMLFKSKTTFRQNYLIPAIQLGYVRLKYPDKPNVPNQKYGLTLKGKALYYERHDSINDVHNDAQRIQADVQNGVQNVGDGPQSIECRIIEIIKAEPDIRRDHIAQKLNISRKTAERYMRNLGIAWLGHPKTGHWVFVKDIQ